MKNAKYIAIIAIAIAFASCDQKRGNATLGGTKDTNAVGGSAAGDTGKNTGSNKMDTTSKGNVNPSGHMGNDSTKNPH